MQDTVRISSIRCMLHAAIFYFAVCFYVVTNQGQCLSEGDINSFEKSISISNPASQLPVYLWVYLARIQLVSCLHALCYGTGTPLDREQTLFFLAATSLVPKLISSSARGRKELGNVGGVKLLTSGSPAKVPPIRLQNEIT